MANITNKTEYCLFPQDVTQTNKAASQTKKTFSGSIAHSHVRPAEAKPSGIVDNVSETADKDLNSRKIAIGAELDIAEVTSTITRKPKLDFDSQELIRWYHQQRKNRFNAKEAEKLSGQPNNPDIIPCNNRKNEERDLLDLGVQELSELIVYQRHPPSGFIMGDAITFGPLTSSEFDQLCCCLEETLDINPARTVIVDACSGSYCYHSALFALAGFTVRPYDHSVIRAEYDKSLTGTHEKALSPFLRPNDKDLTQITSDFFDDNSILFMSFPDSGSDSPSTLLVNRYTESKALKQVVILLIHTYDTNKHCTIGSGISVSKQTLEFLKENYQLIKTIDTDRFEDQPTQLQIYTRCKSQKNGGESASYALNEAESP